MLSHLTANKLHSTANHLWLTEELVRQAFQSPHRLRLMKEGSFGLYGDRLRQPLARTRKSRLDRAERNSRDICFSNGSHETGHAKNDIIRRVSHRDFTAAKGSYDIDGPTCEVLTGNLRDGCRDRVQRGQLGIDGKQRIIRVQFLQNLGQGWVEYGTFENDGSDLCGEIRDRKLGHETRQVKRIDCICPRYAAEANQKDDKRQLHRCSRHSHLSRASSTCEVCRGKYFRPCRELRLYCAVLRCYFGTKVRHCG